MKAMNIVNKVRYFLGILGAAALALSCEQLTEPPSGPEASGETGIVIISASMGSAASTESAASEEGGALPGITRTILPSGTQVFSRYRLVFSRSGYTDITVDNAQGLDGAGLSRELAAGTWTVTVSAYRKFTSGGAEYEAARGSASLAAAAGQTTQVTVYIAPLMEGTAAKGKFTYKVSFPAGASGTLTIGGVSSPLTSGSVVSVEKAPGYYDLSVTLSKGALSAGLWEKVHIYSGLESKAEFAFTDADFAPTVYLAGTITLPAGVTLASGTIYIYSDANYTKKIGQAAASAAWLANVPASNIGSTLYFLAIASGADGKTYVGTGDSGGALPEAGKRYITIAAALIKSLALVNTYLAAVTGGASAADPVPLPVGINLANDCSALLNAIKNAGKYVALDLSACSMSGMTGTAGEFDPVGAYNGGSQIVSLVLPNAATSITAGSWGNSTFRYFSALKNVSGSHIQTVGTYAFQSCTTLTTVDLPAAASIGDDAFDGCAALTTVSLPAATSIGDYAFANCNALTTVSLPKATSIYKSAFRKCTSLTTVSLPKATYIGGWAFAGCSKLTTITVDTNNAYYKSNGGMLLNKNGDKLIAYPSAKGAVTLPGSITSIGDSAFGDCDALTTVNLPAATSIGHSAFGVCTSLTTVSLPAATSIGDHAFQDCKALTTVSLPAATSIGSSAFLRCDALTTVSLPAATSIGSSAFWDCDALTTVSLPAATSIFNYAFNGCGALTTVSLGSTAPTLGYNMFPYITAAKTVTVKVPSGATGYGTISATYSGSDSTANWGNGFRGGGWTGSAFRDSSYINTNITLKIQYQ